MEQPLRITPAARLAPLAAALIALPAAAQLSAQNPPVPRNAEAAGGGGPFYVGVSQAFTRESNIFRVPKGADETSDTISTTSLLAGVDAPFGRQRATADVQLSHNKFKDQDQLDHTGLRVGLGLDWEAASKLSGNVSVAGQQRLARFGTEGTGLTTNKILERARQLGARVQYGGESVLAIYGLVDHRAIDFSGGDQSFQNLEYERNMVGAGVRYRVGGALTLGLEARTGSGKYPNFQPSLTAPVASDDFDRREVALTAQWVPTGASRIDARLGATKQDHDLEVRDFSGATGSVLWRYEPTGKLRLETELRRDTGQEIEPVRIAGVVDTVADNSVVANRLQLRALYAATAKISLDALVRYTRRDLDGTVSLFGGTASSGSDATTLLRLGVRWEPTRTVALGCGIGREDRSASDDVPGASSYDYKVNSANCFAQLVLNP